MKDLLASNICSRTTYHFHCQTQWPLMLLHQITSQKNHAFDLVI